MKFGFILSILFLGGISFPYSFLYAQNNQLDPIQSAPTGQGTLAPKVYFENSAPGGAPPVPVPVLAPSPASSPVAVPISSPSAPEEITVTSNKNFFSGLLSEKLKLTLHGIGKSCEVGSERPFPWALVNAGAGIDSKEELLVVLNQAIESDHRIRRITVNQNKIQIDYLQPARVFGVIPINYLFNIETDTSTFTTRVIDPKFISFATTFHKQVSLALSDGLTQIYTRSNLEYVRNQNLYYKHSFATAVTTGIMSPIDVYPFGRSFWLCTIVPYFLIFLILGSFIFGYILFWLAKKRRDRYIKQIRGDYAPENRQTSNKQTHVATDTIDFDNETLDDYLQTKRFKK
jgi:hypothetical protein